jgi:hypothetical protein
MKIQFGGSKNRLPSSALPAGLRWLSDLATPRQECIPTGFDELSSHLPGRGWPVGALTEIVSNTQGTGELRLTMPALANLTARGKRVVWISPPFIPYAPVLANYGVDLSRTLLIQSQVMDENLWAAEQVLRSRATGAVLLWPTHGIDARRLRRLQLAAEEGASIGFLFRIGPERMYSSPAALRLKLNRIAEGLQIQVLKCQGANPGGQILLQGN